MGRHPGHKTNKLAQNPPTTPTTTPDDGNLNLDLARQGIDEPCRCAHATNHTNPKPAIGAKCRCDYGLQSQDARLSAAQVAVTVVPSGSRSPC